MAKMPAEKSESGHETATRLNPSVLVQLAFCHMLAVIKVQQELITLLPQLAPRPPILPPRKDLKLERSLRKLLDELIAPCDDSLIDHPWSPPQGVLSRVRRDASRLSAEFTDSDEAFLWWEIVEEAWRAAFVIHEKRAAPTHAVISKIIDLLERVTTGLMSLLICFRKDENVVFCVLRHHLQLDQSLGYGYAATLLQRFHSRGLTGLQNFLVTNYKRRGFRELVPQINKSIGKVSDRLAALA